MKKRLLSWLLVLTMVVSLIPSTLVTAFAADAPSGGVDITGAQTLTLSADSDTVITAGGTYTVSGSSTHSIVIGADAADGTAATKVNVTLVLNGLKINSATSPIQILGGSELTLVLVDGTENVLNCTKTGNAGEFDTSAGAGILCEFGAKLTIDKAQGGAGTGSLTVTGGYGGAGIGSGRFTSLYTNERAAKGGGSTRNYNLGNQVNWQGGVGGEGGRHGANAGTAGSVTINAGVLNITGGNGAAGIGGGMGAAGEAGANGNNANSVVRFDGGGAAGGWFGTGGGGGGAGGNGGRGGAGGDVTINGGAVTVTGGHFTLNRSGKTVDVIPASIGGGAGGIGGAGGDGGAPANSTVNQPGDRWGTKGGIGETGYMNYNGDGGNLIVNGGKLSAVGNIRVGEDANKKGIQCAWADRDQGYSRGGYHCGYAAGLGAESTAPTLDGEQKALNIKINASDNNVRFFDYNNATNLSTQPTNKSGETLYEVTLTVRDRSQTKEDGANTSIVTSANVEVGVHKDDALAAYVYKTVSDLTGKATLWLPAGDYTLSYFDVYRDDVGIIHQDDGVEFSVKTDNLNTTEVKIGLDVEARTTVSGQSKVYVNDKTTDATAQLAIQVDASKTVNSELGNITWFREKVNGNDKTYGLHQTISEIGFDTGLNNVTNAADKGTVMISGTTKEYNIPILENGRYWIKIPVKVFDPNNHSKSMTVNLVRLVEVKNIYREFTIQTRTQEMTRDSNVKFTTEYEALKNGNGTDYQASYGFPWDLHGYNSTDVTKGTLLTGVEYDTVPVNGLTSKVKWYNAAFGAKGTEITKNTAGTAFVPVTLTLDQDFLTNNQDADKVDDKIDPTKYTITYTPEGVPVAEVTIRGIVQNDNGSEKEELWSYTNSYPEGVTEATINGFVQAGYRIDKVLVNGTEKNGLTDNSIHLENLQGTQENNYTDAINKVEFVYVSNMTNVTIHGYVDGTKDKVFEDRTVSAEIGKPFTYPQPVVDGYDNKSVTPAGGSIDAVAEGAEITFYYLHSNGNVTYVAQDADGNTPLTSKTITVENGGTIDKTAAKAAEVLGTIQYYTLDGDGTATADTYDGIHDVTVTYTYTRNKHKLTVEKKDIDSRQPIDTQEILGVPAGKTYTFGDTVTAVQDYTAVAALNPTSFDMGDADATVTFWYRKNDANRYATITVNSLCDEDNDGTPEVFRTYQIPAFKDVELTIPAPEWDGYQLKDPTRSSQIITPTGNMAVNFEYVLDAPRTIRVELNNNTDGGTLPAPQGYQTEYVIKKGGSVTIQAPVINGYALVNGSSIVTVNYDDAEPADNKVVFNYASVETANFVKHTIVFKNHDESIEFYRYSTLISKSDSETTYTADSVKNVIAGYKLKDIRMEIDSVDAGTSSTSVTAPNNKNVTIVYRFEEDTSRIVIKKVTSTGEPIGEPTVLSGYRTGLKNVEVTAPLVDKYALAANEPLTKSITELKSGDNEITFKYDQIGNVTFTLKEHNNATNQDEIIVIRNGVAGQEYNPAKDSNPLNLSADKYTFLPSDDADEPFGPNQNHSVTVTDTSNKKNYDVYYTKGTREVKFVAINSDKLPQDDFATATPEQIKNAKIITRDVTERARVGEMYKASAQSIDRYALNDQITKYYTVEESDQPLYVYFWYKAKSVGTVTVHYHTGLTADNHTSAQLLMSYSLDAVAGEKVSIKIPRYLENGKYKLPENEATEKTHTVTTGDNVIDINYDPNFVTVKVMTKRSDHANPALYDTYEVNKTDAQGTVTGNLTLTPPYRAGYTLVGITGVEGGTEKKLPDSFKNGKLTLTGLKANTEITYYYNKTSATEYQSDLTISYLYNGYKLAEDKPVKVNLGEANTIDVPTFEGYEAETYQFTDGTTAGTTPGRKTDITTTSISVTPTQKTGTLVITYIRPDGSVVLPGEDGKIPAPNDKDNVIVKPGEGTTIEGPRDDGSVKIPENGTGTVTRPDPDNKPDGKEDIKVPGGTVIKPDGTIELPGGGEIKPGDKIPDDLPADYIAITYIANNGTGAITKEIGKPNALTVRGSLFTGVGGAAFAGWYDNGFRRGTPYAQGTAVAQSITLYAAWDSSTRYAATVTYKPNGGTPAEDVVQTVGSDVDADLIAVVARNTFAVDGGWKFGGWNTQANGMGTQADGTIKLYQPGDELKLARNDAVVLHAQWYKQSGSTITIPGQDGDPTNEDTNVTGSGAGISRDPATGVITIPDGGTITTKDETISLPDGGKLNPDGTIIINRPGGGTITIPGKDGTTPDVTDPDGNDVPNAELVRMTYHSNNGENNSVNVVAVKGDQIAIIDNPFAWNSSYRFLNWVDDNDTAYAPGEKIAADNMAFSAQWYKQNADGSIELPGKDGAIEPPHDKDNVTVTPDKPNGTLDGPKGDGSVDVKDDEATVTRPDPTDPDFPEGSKEDVKVPEGSTVYPDGTIKLPDGTIIKPEDKLPDDVISRDYAIVTYEPNGGSGNVIRQMLKRGEAATVLGSDTFTAPSKHDFEKWLDEDNNKSYEAGSELTPARDMTLTAQWKKSTPAPTTYSAQIVFDSNTDEGTDTQKLTSTTDERISGTLRAYADLFTAPADWTFMGWSTRKAASRLSRFYADGASITLNDGDVLDLFAILYKLDADTGVITLPGQDGEPETADDVTVTPPTGGALTPGGGYVTAPAGSEIEQPSGTITVIEGEVRVYPDGSVYVPEGSKVTDKGGNEVTGPAVIDPDGSTDTDKTKPVLRPDGTIILPGADNDITTPDDNITIHPAGPNTPAGTIDDVTGDVTITDPDGAEVTIPGNDPENVRVPEGTVITPKGEITLVYTIRYVDENGRRVRTSRYRWLQVGETETVKYATVSGYKLTSEETVTITAQLSDDLDDYIVIFTYAKKSGDDSDNTGGGSGGGGGGGGGKPTTRDDDDQDPTRNPETGVKLPEYTGVADWLETDDHYAYMNGIGGDRFAPDANMTRAQVAQMFYNLLIDKNVDITARFTDVPADAWYATAVNTLASIGAITGIGNNQFAPNRTITRAEFTAIAVRFARLVRGADADFSDVPANAWYYDSIATAVEYGWIGGYADGTFRPNKSITRAEVVTIVNRMLNRSFDTSVSYRTVTRFTDVPTSHWAFEAIVEATTGHDHFFKKGVENWDW